MSAINLKSITGITSITTPAGVDNVFTVHTNDTTERFRIDQTGNQNIVGIVTVTKDLDVDGHTELDNVNIAGVTTFTNGYINLKPANGGDAHFRILSTGSGDAGIFFDAANGDITGSDYVFLGQKNNLDFVINPNANAGNIDFQRGGTTNVRIKSDGKVGINELNPTEMLHIKAEDNTDSFGGIIVYANNNSVYTKHGWRGLDSNEAVRFAISGTEKMRLTNGGKLALGRSSADEMLHITHDDNTDGFGGIKIAANNNSVYVKYGWRGIDGSADLRFGVAGNEKLRIDSSGRLIVGGGTHAGGSALVVKGGGVNTYSTIGMFSNHTNPSGDTLLSQIRFGANGTAVGADIRATADAAWGTNDYPTRLSFYTTPDSSNSRQERLRITSGGKISYNYDGSFVSSVADVDIRTNNGLHVRGVDGNTNNANIYIGGAVNNQRKTAIIHDPVGGYCRGDLHFCLENSADLSDVDVTDSKMKISAAGYVTKSNHPSFYVRRSTGGDGRSAATPITEWSSTYDNGAHNNGGHFNTSTGLFTAPVNGFYHFSAAGGYKQSNVSFNQKFRLNSTTITEGTRFISGLTSHSTATISATIYMDAGDTLGLVMEYTHHVNTTFNYFSGHLVG